MERTTADRRRALRQHFLEHAAAAFDLMFDEALADGVVTFEQREQRATELGHQVLLALLEQHAQDDPAADPAEDCPPPCPRCQKPGRRASPPGRPLPARAITTCAGEVTLRRAKYRCTTCRVVFFPPR